MHSLFNFRVNCIFHLCASLACPIVQALLAQSGLITVKPHP